MNIDHICIAVRKLEKSVPRFCELFDYRVKTEPVTNTRQKVTVQFVEKPGSLDVKFIEPAGEDSPLWRSLRGGEGLHHVCFRTADVEDGVQALTGKGSFASVP
jgi:catechol 2,3-dioxygenase-like lactoylglutathione lyase family enzyme